MKVAVIGSRSLVVADLERFLPENIAEIISGGACGIDNCAAKYAAAHNIKLTEFLPQYEKYGRNAPLKRNLQIIEHADLVFAFWDGYSKGTEFVIRQCRRQHKPLQVIKVYEETALCGGIAPYRICCTDHSSK